MSEKKPGISETRLPGVYEICLRGHLDSHWLAELEGFELTIQNGDSCLTGRVADQAALYGLLRKVKDFGFPLISVLRVSAEFSARDYSRSGGEK